MRLAAAFLAVAFPALACLPTAAHAQAPFTPVTLTGDIDADGKPDRVELKLADNGVQQVIAHLSGQPGNPMRVVEMAEPGASLSIELRKAGTYPVLYQGKTGERVFAGDVVLADPGPNGRRLVFWEDGFLRSAWLKE